MVLHEVVQYVGGFAAAEVSLKPMIRFERECLVLSKLVNSSFHLVDLGRQYCARKGYHLPLPIDFSLKHDCMNVRQFVKKHFPDIKDIEQAASVWSDCGEIIRCKLNGEACVIKAIEVPQQINHSRITQSEFALARKRQSYLVEFNWYQQFSGQLPLEAAAIPCLNAVQENNQQALLFADFTACGYQQAQASSAHIDAILRWLAHFHAVNLSSTAEGLWPQGSYWHLATRPDEYARMTHSSLKVEAENIDTALKQCVYQTLIHGDAKLANFAIKPHTNCVYGYDFQYVGKGVGIIDVMYFLGSCLSDKALHTDASAYLDQYYDELALALKCYKPNISAADVIASWDELWAYAWADFYRFLAGWSPEHLKINRYMQSQFNYYLTKKGT